MNTEHEEQGNPAQQPAGETRAGFVALIGAPNVGKSTLVNSLVGAKVTIVTPKVQTTRTLVRGIAMEGQSQIVLVDTPGIFAPKRRLDRAMVTSAWSGAHDADLVCVLIDARRGLDDETEAMFAGLGDIPQPKVLVINKVDIVDKPKLLALTTRANELAKFDATFMVAAISNYGVLDLRAYLARHMSPGPWLYPEDQIADAPAQSLSTEITREKLFLKLYRELPYQLTVEVEQWKELRGGALRIEQTIYVERESQRKIVLGEGGQMIKHVGAAARKELSELLEREVHLFLFVKVREGWADDPERYRQMGLEFPKE